MTNEELWLIVERARAGGGEGEDLEFKRSWWTFDKAEAVTEFRKDVTAMCNAHGNLDRARHLVIGLDGDGALHAAPLPVDEARLQELIRSKVTPCPQLRIEPHEVDGTRVSILVLEPPFDRPYVTPDDRNRPTVWVRKGSSISTATRADLDAMYRNQARSAELSVRWCDERGGDVVLPGPVTPDRATLVSRLESQLAEVRAEVDAATDPDDAGAAEGRRFLHDCAEFLAEVADDASFQEWYCIRHRDRRVTVRFVASNRGTGPATELRVVIRLPPWIMAAEADGVGEGDHRLRVVEVPKRPDFEVARTIAAAEKAERERLRQMFGGATWNALTQAKLAAAALESMRGWDPPPLSSYRRSPLAPDVRVDGGEVSWMNREVLHDHVETSRDEVVLLALPGAPVGDHLIEGTVFHRELRARRPIRLMLRVGGSP